MRFSTYILSVLLFLGSCSNTQLYSLKTEDYKSIDKHVQQDTSATRSAQQESGILDGTPYDRLFENIRIKQSDAFGITYEYKNVRIDEIAYLAAQYCYEQGEKRAYLYDSQLYKNYSRRATFHCVELQN